MDQHGTAGAVIRWTQVPNVEAEGTELSKLVHDKSNFEVAEWLTHAEISDRSRDNYFKLEAVSLSSNWCEH